MWFSRRSTTTCFEALEGLAHRTKVVWGLGMIYELGHSRFILMLFSFLCLMLFGLLWRSRTLCFMTGGSGSDLLGCHL